MPDGNALNNETEDWKMDEQKKFQQNKNEPVQAPKSDILNSETMEQGLAQERARLQRQQQLADWEKARTNKR